MISPSPRCTEQVWSGFRPQNLVQKRRCFSTRFPVPDSASSSSSYQGWKTWVPTPSAMSTQRELQKTSPPAQRPRAAPDRNPSYLEGRTTCSTGWGRRIASHPSSIWQVEGCQRECQNCSKYKSHTCYRSMFIIRCILQIWRDCKIQGSPPRHEV